MEVRSVGNSQTLKETALIEAFNLKVGATPRHATPRHASLCLCCMA